MDAWEILEARGFVKQTTDAALLRRAFAEERVTYYVGFDPTADSLHVGHMLPIMAMAHLQRAGHRPIAVAGGGTAMVGDPSGKSEMRQMLTAEAIASNLVAIKAQLSRFLKFGDGEGLLVDNADWLMGLNYIGFLRDIGRHFSVNRMLAAEAYKLRLERGLSFIEFNYQLLQAYDALELFRRHGCKLQMGGDDQWGNILAGTELIRRVEGVDAHGLTFPLITTATGEKMGKTAAGAVWLDPQRMAPFDFYQYWLNVDDRDVGRFLRLYTFLELDEIVGLEALTGSDIRVAKRRLAHAVTALVHSEADALKAAAAAEAMASGSASADLPTWSLPATEEAARIVDVLVSCGLAASRGDAKKTLQNGGVYVGTERVTDVQAALPPLGDDGVVLKLGKSKAVRIVRGA